MREHLHTILLGIILSWKDSIYPSVFVIGGRDWEWIPRDRCASAAPPGWLCWRIRQGESAGALPRGLPRLLLFSPDSTSETQNRWQRKGKLKGWLVFPMFCVCVYPGGVSIGYVYHIVHDINHVAAWCGSLICPAWLVTVASVRPSACCEIQ